MLVALCRFQLHVTGGEGTLQTVVRHVEGRIVIWKAISSLFSRAKVYDGYAIVEAGGAGGGQKC